jgi:AcrR family transcriptional regulator
MTGKERREQLLDISRALFAVRGYDGTSVEEIAAKAGVSKPVVYEHFGGKEGLYAVVVDREMERLLGMVTRALREGVHYRDKLEQAALALLEYIEEDTDGFRILVRDSHGTSGTGGFASLLSEIARQVEHVLGQEFDEHGYDDKTAPMYAQMLVGMVALTGQWWLEARKPKREEVAAHVVNLAWNGLSRLEPKPHLDAKRRRKERVKLERRAEKAAAKAERKSRKAGGAPEGTAVEVEPVGEVPPPAPA